jgi:flagellar biosynthesis protein FlhG
MYDQAADLRDLVRRGATLRPTAPSPSPRLVAIGGGKGGVGTTTIAVNLAVALAQQGRRTALVDADPHGGDAAMLLGLDERHTLADVLQSRRTVDEAFAPGVAGLWVLPAAWAEGGVPEASTAAHERLFSQLGDLGHRVECLVVDVGNAPDRLARRFWQAADLTLMVTTPEEASVMAAYARIKALASSRDSGPIHTLVNRAPGDTTAREVHARLAQACLRFLDVWPVGLGHLADDPSIAAAGRAREPFVTSTPHGQNARRIGRLAETVVRLAKRPRVAA